MDPPPPPRQGTTDGPSVASTPPSTSLVSHRSHDPSNNLKRSDPFQFGSRHLQQDDDVFEFNAWDHVETDDAYKEYSELQYSKQRESPVSDFDKRRFNADPAKWWNVFYKNNATNFFKDRKWLRQEFPILSSLTRADAPPSTILEVGAGAGNTAFPILAHNLNPGLKLHACDFSKTAVELLRGHAAYDERVMRADVWDVAGPDLPPGLDEGGVDVVLMIFVFSALAPAQWSAAVRNVWRLLRPGGEVLFRDYGRGDMAQVRFRKGRYLDENFYVRGDGTRVYFFEREELESVWAGDAVEREFTAGEGARLDERDASARFSVVNLDVDRRLLVNRQRRLKMYRCWVQGRFRKPGDSSSRPDQDQSRAAQ